MSVSAGFVGLVGRPNAGKSTLVNNVIGEKVGIVTSKPQTTRQRVVGVFSQEDLQVLFVDAPGAIRAESGINQFLQKELDDVIENSDVLVAVLNVDEKDPKKLDTIVEMTAKANKPWIAVITKTDLSVAHRALILKSKLDDYDVPVIEVAKKFSSKKLQDLLLPLLKERLPKAESPLFDPDIYTTQNTRELCAEIIREKCFEYVHDEIPYGLAVKVLKFIENQGPVVKIYAEIVVNKEGHRGIVVGQKAQSIRRIGMMARKEMEKILGRQVYLDLHVRVKKNWIKQEKMMKDMGYVVPEQR